MGATDAVGASRMTTVEQLTEQVMATMSIASNALRRNNTK